MAERGGGGGGGGWLLLPLLSGDQCSASEAGWLLGIPQWDYSGQENMESQRKRHYDIKQSIWMHLCVV